MGQANSAFFFIRAYVLLAQPSPTWAIGQIGAKQAKIFKNTINTKDVSNIDLTTMIFEVNLVGSNPKEWWIDIGATFHVCLDKKMFSTFDPIEIGKRCSWGTRPPLKSRAKEKCS